MGRSGDPGHIAPNGDTFDLLGFVDRDSAEVNNFFFSVGAFLAFGEYDAFALGGRELFYEGYC